MYKKLKKLLFFSILLVNEFAFSCKRAEKDENKSYSHNLKEVEELGVIKRLTFLEQSFFVKNEIKDAFVEVTPRIENGLTAPTSFCLKTNEIKEFKFIYDPVYKFSGYNILFKDNNGTSVCWRF